MFQMNYLLNSSAKQDLFILTSCLKRLPSNYIIQLCPVSTRGVPSPQDPPRTSNIPSLPVQPLETMLQKYIKSVRPFVDQVEFEKTQELARQFCQDKNLGLKLQKLLEERAKTTENWLADWWLKTAYLEYRKPVIVYSSPGLVWPKKTFRNQTEQLLFTAHLIAFALEFNTLVEEKKISQETLGDSILCMSQYDKIFGTCRIPNTPRDELLFQDPNNPSRNIIILYNNHVFNVSTFEENSRKPLSASHFFSALQDVVQEGDKEPGPPIGILTTENRDNWAKAYKELKQDATNKELLEKYIEKALFVVCLDKPLTLGGGLNYGTRCSKLLLHGFGQKGNASNRWYDKTIQFIVGADSDGLGIAYEHSPAEGGPIGVLTDYIVSKIDALELKMQNLESFTDYPKPQKLNFVVSSSIKQAMEAAGKAVDKISDELDVFGWSFPKFGKEVIKNLKVSPDSFIQIAIQYAFYKIHKHPGAQYESGSLRKYIYGRTDTIRSCSDEAVRFCEVMSNENASKSEKEKALRKAISYHKLCAHEVTQGLGVDRHLLGLKILAKQNNLEDLKLFSDVAFQRSTYFQLSTSNVPTKCNGFMVYGPLVDDGYACCYNPRSENINFGMSAWANCKSTRLIGFQKALFNALIEMRYCLDHQKYQSKL